MPQLSSYFSKLTFDRKLEQSRVAGYLRQPRLTILLVLMIVIIGIFSYLQIPRVLNPDIKIPIVIVSTVLPGANPKDVESLVTIPIEDGLASITKVDKITSSSRDSVSLITLSFLTGVDPEKARADVQSAVDSVTNLPTDAKAPKVIKLDFQNQPVWTFAITSKNSYASLHQFAKNLEKKLEDSKSVNNVELSGLDTTEIQILIKPEVIANNGINPLQLSSAIRSALNAVPAGSVSTDNSTFGLSIDPSITSIDDIRNLQINVAGEIVSLSQIATISERSTPNSTPAYLASVSPATRSVTFNVFKTSNSNIDSAVTESRSIVESEIKNYKSQFKVWDILDTAQMVDDQFNELLKDFALTVGLIFLVLFIFLGIRQALVAGLTTPLTFLIVFIVMNITGIQISFISLFSLLLALGLLVDDTIVVISAMTAYNRTKKFTPYQTGILVWKDFFVPILTTTITTVWAFFPLLLSGGIIGEFIKPIPIVTSTALLASIAVAMLITLPFTVFLLKPSLPLRVIVLFRLIGILLLIAALFTILPKTILIIPIFILIALSLFSGSILLKRFYKDRFSKESLLNSSWKERLNTGIISFEPITKGYHNLIEKILNSQKSRRLTILMVTIFCIFSYLLLPFGFVVNEFFPKSDGDFLYVSVRLPSGTNSDTTKNEALRLTEELRKTPGVTFVNTTLGQSVGDSGATASEENNILLTLLLDTKQKHVSSLELSDKLRETYKHYNQGQLSVVEESGGPPAGADLQINLFGDNLNQLNVYAKQLMAYLKNQPGVTNVDTSIKSGTSKIVFVPDQQKLSQANISLDQVGLWLRTYASGFSMGTTKFDNTSEDVVLRLSSTTEHPENISALTIPTQNGDIPLSQLGSLKLEANPTLITREDGKRTLSVTATVTKGYSISTLNTKLSAYASTLSYEPGYSWNVGGVNDENQKSVMSILQAMLLSFLLIIITMVIQFQSFRKAIIVMLVIPLSISGVFIVFAISHTPLSFPALIGVLALFGIVVKNSILIVDKITQNNKLGIPFVTSIADGASSRLEAISLTSMTAIIGLIPITLSDPLWRGLGGAIISGLMFSGTIMLFFIPVVYYNFFREKNI